MWNKTIQTVANIQNRSYSTVLNNVTLAEMWFGFNLEMSNFRVFMKMIPMKTFLILEEI